jgi:hypothetical protein
MKNTSAFTIQHYAGQVSYDATGFLDKNKDTFFRDLKEILISSSIPLVKELVLPDEISYDDKKRPVTAGTSFQVGPDRGSQETEPSGDPDEGPLCVQPALHPLREAQLYQAATDLRCPADLRPSEVLG